MNNAALLNLGCAIGFLVAGLKTLDWIYYAGAVFFFFCALLLFND